LLLAALCFHLAIRLGHPAPSFGRAGAPVQNDCAPGYLAIDPDGSAVKTEQFQLEVLTLEAKRSGRWVHDYVFPTRARCLEAWTVADDLRREGGDPAKRITVGPCR
jgi:hypothetical protein